MQWQLSSTFNRYKRSGASYVAVWVICSGGWLCSCGWLTSCDHLLAEVIRLPPEHLTYCTATGSHLAHERRQLQTSADSRGGQHCSCAADYLQHQLDCPVDQQCTCTHHSATALHWACNTATGGQLGMSSQQVTAETTSLRHHTPTSSWTQPK